MQHPPCNFSYRKQPHGHRRGVEALQGGTGPGAHCERAEDSVLVGKFCLRVCVHMCSNLVSRYASEKWCGI